MHGHAGWRGSPDQGRHAETLMSRVARQGAWAGQRAGPRHGTLGDAPCGIWRGTWPVDYGRNPLQAQGIGSLAASRLTGGADCRHNYFVTYVQRLLAWIAGLECRHLPIARGTAKAPAALIPPSRPSIRPELLGGTGPRGRRAGHRDAPVWTQASRCHASGAGAPLATVPWGTVLGVASRSGRRCGPASGRRSRAMAAASRSGGYGAQTCAETGRRPSHPSENDCLS